jgi:hypothetical protein
MIKGKGNLSPTKSIITLATVHQMYRGKSDGRSRPALVMANIVCHQRTVASGNLPRSSLASSPP